MSQKFTVAAGSGSRTLTADEIDGGPPDPDAFEVESAVDVSDGEPYAVEGGIDADDIPSLPTLVGQSSPAEENETRAKIAQWHKDVRALGVDPSAAFEIVTGGKSSGDAPVEPRTLPSGDDAYSAERIDADGEDEYRPEGMMGAQSSARADGSGVPAWSDTSPDDEDDEYRPEGVMGATRSAAQSARDRFTAARDAAPSVPEGWRPQGLFTDDGEGADGDGIFGPGVEEYEPSEDVNDEILNPDVADDPWGDALGGDPDADAGGVDLDEHRDAVIGARGDYRGKAGPDPRTSSQSARPSYQTGVNSVGLDSVQSGDAGGEDDEDDRPIGVFTADPEDDPEDDEHRPSGLFTEVDNE